MKMFLILVLMFVCSNHLMGQDVKFASPEPPDPYELKAIKADLELLKRRVDALEGKSPKAAPAEKQSTTPIRSYLDGIRQAQKEAAPMLVFVGVSPRTVEGFISAYEDALSPLASGVYVAWIGADGKLMGSSTRLSATFSEADIAAAVNAVGSDVQLPKRLARLRVATAAPLSAVQRVLLNSSPLENCYRGF